MLPTLPSYELERLADECEAAGVGPAYRAMLAKGTYPREAAMYALQAAPGTKNTDRAFCEGARRQMENMPAINRQGILELAKQAGINTSGKFYKGSLGKATDPTAWVSTADDVLAVCKAKNLDCTGVVNHKAIDKDYVPKQVRLNPKLVNELERKYVKANPGLAEKVKRNKHARMELRERIIETHGQKKRKS